MIATLTVHGMKNELESARPLGDDLHENHSWKGLETCCHDVQKHDVMTGG